MPRDPTPKQLYDNIHRLEVALDLLPHGQVRDRVLLDLAKLRRDTRLEHVSEPGRQRLEDDRGQTDGQRESQSSGKGGGHG